MNTFLSLSRTQLRWIVGIAVVLLSAAIAIEASGSGGSSARAAHRARAADMVADTFTPATTTREPRCFGAASHDPAKPCNNPALRSMVSPTPRAARNRPNAPCTILDNSDPLHVCAFGTPPSRASATIALLGDSHAMHWRAAVERVARAKHWYGLSIALGGCPYSTATRVIEEPLRSRCIERNREVPDWFRQHPEIHTVFVTGISGAKWMLAPGESQFAGQMNHYLEAWAALPASVTHIVVIRDTPKALPSTRGCIERARAKGQDAGIACRMPRRAVLNQDPAVVAAQVATEQFGSTRFDIADLTRYFCDRRWCEPVIGGALVQKDVNHLSSVFVSTLGPYLLHQVDHVMAGWR
ncbi:MAG: SGNH hydrolase domain-containing protein [Thermoleophilaceae bacterium]